MFCLVPCLGLFLFLRISSLFLLYALLAPADAVFMAAAEKFASWAAVEEVNEEHPIKYLTGLTDESDFEDLSSANKRLVLNLAFR